MIKTISVLAIFITLFFITCDSNKSVTECYDELDQSIDLSVYYPLNIGNTWIYRRTGIGEIGIIQHTIVDTLRHIDGSLLHKFQKGILNFPPESFFFDYLSWNNDGLWYYQCETDSCENSDGQVAPLWKYLIMPRSAAPGEVWTTFVNYPIYTFEYLDSLTVTDEWRNYSAV